MTKKVTTISQIDIDQQNEHALSIAQTHLDQALQIAHQTYEHATAQEYAKGIADSLLVQAQVNFYHAQYETVFTQLGKAVAVYDSTQDYSRHARALHILGITFRQIGDFSSAIDAFSRGLSSAKKASDPQGEMRMLNGLASIYGNSHQHSLALNYLLEALDIARAGKFEEQEALLLGNLCYEYTNLGKRDLALKYGLESWRRYRTMENPPFGVVNTCTRISETYYDIGDMQEALRFANQGLALAYKFNAKAEIIHLLHHIGAIYADLNDTTTALAYADEGIAIAKQHDIEISSYDIFLFASQMYKLLGDYQKALANLERYHELRVAVYTEESEAKMQQLEARYRVEAVQKEAEFYQVRNKELEHLREQDQHYYTRLNEMKDKFIREASHDLKNPLAIILLNINLAEKMLERGNLDRVQSYLEQIKTQTLRSKDLVTELLDLAWLETGRALDSQPVQIVPLIGNLVEQMRSLAVQKDIILTFVPYIPDGVRLFADKKQLARVVDNLLSNAIKYTPSGGMVTTEIRMETDDTGQQVVVSISDTGRGLTDEQKQLVFEPFYKAHEEVESESTGLGLTIVQTIIQQHGGEMLVQSEIGRGSTFGFRLPLTI